MNILIITKLYADWSQNQTMKNQLLTTIFLGDIGEGTVSLMHYTFVIELDIFFIPHYSNATEFAT